MEWFLKKGEKKSKLKKDLIRAQFGRLRGIVFMKAAKISNQG
jgi:hypothetical protein